MAKTWCEYNIMGQFLRLWSNIDNLTNNIKFALYKHEKKKSDFLLNALWKQNPDFVHTRSTQKADFFQNLIPEWVNENNFQWKKNYLVHAGNNYQ